MTFDECTVIFSDECKSPEEITVRLAISYPDFSYSDLLSVFQEITHNYQTDLDRIRNSKSGFWNMLHLPVMYKSDGILRNLYRMMFETKYWDTEILFQPVFIDGFSEIVDDLKSDFRRTKTATRCDSRKLDIYEKLAEFRDRLNEKIQNAANL